MRSSLLRFKNMLSVSGKINDKYISKNKTHPGHAYHRIVPEVEFAKMVEMNRRKLFRRIKKMRERK